MPAQAQETAAPRPAADPRYVLEMSLTRAAAEANINGVELGPIPGMDRAMNMSYHLIR